MADNNSQKGTSRGNSFYVGIVLLLVGVFLVLQNTRVSASWYVWRIGGFGMPTGIVVLPLLVGIGIWVYKPKAIAGKIVAAAGLLFILITIVLSVNIHFMSTGLFNYILMFGTIAAGIALTLRGLLQKRPKT